MLEGYKADLKPENERHERCAWCGERAVIARRGFYRCARHDRTTGKPPQRRTTEKPSPEELARAVAGGIVTAHGAVEIARKR